MCTIELGQGTVTALEGLDIKRALGLLWPEIKIVLQYAPSQHRLIH